MALTEVGQLRTADRVRHEDSKIGPTVVTVWSPLHVPRLDPGEIAAFDKAIDLAGPRP